MSIIRIFVQRPVLTTMIVLAFIVLGVYSYGRLPIELTPNVEFPFVIVTTIYPGASPGEVETQITNRIEDAVSTISNVKSLTSVSQENLSQVFIEFELETDVDMDAIEVKDKVDAIQYLMPENAERSSISKFDIQSFPVMEIAVSAPRPLEQVYRIADKVVKDRLSRIDGVASVEIVGKRERQILVEVSPERLRAYDLGIVDIAGVLSAANLNIPSGHIARGSREISIRMIGEVSNPKEIADLRVPIKAGGTIPLSEVANVVDGSEEMREFSAYNGEPVIGMSVYKRSDGNTVRVAKGVYRALEELRSALDPDVTLTLTQNRAPFIERAVKDVLANVMIGILLTALLLLLFLHNWQQTIVAALSMPVSVIATFFLMERSGFTINVLSLLALGISIGTLVTNAIVIIENITRFVHLGHPPEEAAIAGTAEVAVAVAASTLTNIVVFTPIAFMSGIVGRFFFQFGLTVVYATIFSLIVSYTMVPMLASKIIKPQQSDRGACDQSRFAVLCAKWDAFYDALSLRYRNLLAKLLARRYPLVLTAIIVLVGSLALFRFVGGEFMPQVDQGLVAVSLRLPPGTSLERTREISSRIEQRIRSHPEVKGVLVKIGGQQRGVEEAEILAQLVDRSERRMHVTDFVNLLRAQMTDIPDAELRISSSGAVGGRREADLVVEVLSSNQGVLEAAADSVAGAFREIPGLVEIQTSLLAGKPEIAVSPRRYHLSEYGLNVASLGAALRAAYEGVKAGVFREGGEEYDVVVKFADEYRQDPASLSEMPLASRSSTIPLSEVGLLTTRAGDSRIQHKSKQRMIEVSANIASGSLSEVRKLFDDKLRRMNIPKGATVRYGGMAEMQSESFASIYTALILAISLLYIVLAAITESFVHPVTIMLTLPLALIGVSVALFFSGQRINVFSLMSIVMLTGIVVNNAILMLDYTAHLRKRGMKIKEALLEACPIRLRPIIMANLAIVVGMLPQILGGAAGYEMRAPMAYVQIGGVLVSAFFTLFLIPVAYTIFDAVTVAGRKERKEETK